MAAHSVFLAFLFARSFSLGGCALLRSSDHLQKSIHVNERMPRREPRKPVTDTRQYLRTTFSSGLDVLVVHDEDAQKSAFAVAVEAGSLEDPADFQGLAHFCEHMLFLGSAKYPDKDAFSQQLALYGGEHNAYTSSEATVYFNEIGNEGFEKGMDIFAQFFIAPSFKAEMVDKEIHAVDSEHKKNMPDTRNRLYHLLRSKANPKNPMHQFSTGNLETLKTQPEKEGKSLVEALKKFHEKNYCSNRLHLVLVSNKATDELLNLAHKYFDGIPMEDDVTCPARPMYIDFPAYAKEQGNLGRRFVMGTHGTPEMWLLFPAPPLKNHYKALPEAYLWNALGNWGAGSLKALLMKEDLSQSYSYYAENSVAASTIFVVFSLTEKGLQNTDRIMEYFFAYVDAMKQAGVDSQLLNHMKQQRQVSFDYQEKKSSEFDFVQTIAGSVPNYAADDLLTGGILIDMPDTDLIWAVLNAIVPENMNVALVDPTFDEANANAHEKYYDFKYSNEPLDAKLIAQLSKASGHGLLAPPDLKYVPTELALIKDGVGEGPPEQIFKQGRVQVWWMGMGGIKLPKAIVSMKLGFPPAILARVEDSVLAAMHTRLVQQALEEPADALQTCGLTYSLSSTNDGLSLSFSGFDQHILDLIQLVLPKVHSHDTTEQNFEMARRQLLMDVGDVTRLESYQHALEAFEVVSVKDRYSRKELERAASNTSLVNAASYERFIVQLFAQAEITLLFAGNIGKARALSITEAIGSALQISHDQSSQVYHEGHVQVIKPSKEVEVRIPNPIAEDPNSATVVAYQFGIPTIADRVHFAMLSEAIERPVFETLRTEHQLGYVVFGYAAPHESIIEIRVLVQGFREGPDAVELLIESTLQNITTRIASMSNEEFVTRKNSLRTALMKKPATMSQWAGQYWGHIWEETNCFEKKQLQLKYLDSEQFDSPAPLLEAWKRTVAPSKARKKIAVKLFGSKLQKEGLMVDRTAAYTDGKATMAEPGVNSSVVITLVESTSVDEALHDEDLWPRKFICENPVPPQPKKSNNSTTVREAGVLKPFGSAHT